MFNFALNDCFSLKVQLSYLCGCLTDSNNSQIVETICTFENGQLMDIIFFKEEQELFTLIIRSRVHFHLARLLQLHVEQEGTQEWPIKQMINHLESDVRNNLHSPIDLIRNLNFQSLDKLIYVDSKQKLKYVNSLIDELRSTPYSLDGIHFHVLSVMVKVLGIKRVYELFPEIENQTCQYLLKVKDLAAYMIDLIVEIIKYNESFFSYLLKSTQSNYLINQMLPKLNKNSPDLMNSLAHSYIIFNTSIDPRVCLKALQLISFDLNSNSEAPVNALVIQSLTSFDESIQISAAELIIDSKKSSQLFIEEHLIWLHNAFPAFLRLNQSAHRKNFLCLVKKMLIRFCSSLNSIRRNKNDENIKPRYTLFIKNIIELLFNHLQGTSSSIQRYLTVETLHTIISVLDSNDNFDLKDVFLKLFNPEAIYSTLIICLIEDTREDNKMAFFNLTVDLIKLKVISNEIIDLEKIKKKALSAAASFNPCDCASAVWLFKGLANFSFLINKFSESEAYFNVIKDILNLIKSSLNDADKSLINAALFNPLHTKLAALRGLIEAFDFNLVQNDQLDKWKLLIERIIQLAFSASHKVALIVCNESPEGHLPMDCEPIDENLIKRLGQSDIGLEKRRCITSQMLLICGWKTIKESALILGRLCSNIKHEEKGPLLNCSQVRLIIKYFVTSLKELVHRGAFEQAYSGFSLVVQNLWTASCSCFKYVEILLQQIISDLESQTSAENIIITTRRSGGLPYMIQAIVSSEPAENQNKYLNMTICRLIKICRLPSVQEWQLIHAFNILTSLIKDHRLSNRMTDHYESCLILCIEMVNSSSYAVANAICINFVALLNKIFGATGLMEPRKNLMSARQFFLRFPNLMQIILNKLKDQSRNTFLVLLLISRLQPSSRDSDFQLNRLIPHLQIICSMCPSFSNREYAARVISQIVCNSESLFTSTMLNYLDELCKNELTTNARHGIYLIIYESVQIVTQSFLLKVSPKILHRFHDDLNLLRQKLITNALPAAKFCMIQHFLILASLSVFLNRNIISVDHLLLSHLESICSHLILLYLHEHEHLHFLSAQQFLFQLFYMCIWNPLFLNFNLVEVFKSDNLPSKLNDHKHQLFRFISHNLLGDVLKDTKLRNEAFTDFEINLPRWIVRSSSQFSYQDKIKHFLANLTEFAEYKSLMNGNNFDKLSSQDIVQMLLIIYALMISDRFEEAKLKPQALLDSLMMIVSNCNQVLDKDTLTYLHLCISSIFNFFIKHHQVVNCVQFHVWCEHLDKLSKSESSELNRMMTAVALEMIFNTITEQNLAKLMKIFPDQLKFIKSLIVCFKAMTNLTQDNELCIRKQVAFLSNLMMKRLVTSSSALTSLSSLDECCKSFYKLFDNLNSTHHLIQALIELIMEQNYLQEIIKEESEDDGVFDKSKLNMYKDELQFIHVIENNFEEFNCTVNCLFFHGEIADEIMDLIKCESLNDILESKLNLSSVSKPEFIKFEYEFKILKTITMIKIWARCSSLCPQCVSHLGSMIQTLMRINPQTVTILTALRSLQNFLSSNFISKSLKLAFDN